MKNRLRDTEDRFEVDAFSVRGELLYSYDICGSCEAHAMLLSINLGLAMDVDSALTIADIPNHFLSGNKDFNKCPR